MKFFVVFPVAWRFGDNPTDGFGGPAVADAGTIYIASDDEDIDCNECEVLAKTTLDAIVADCLDGWRTKEGYTAEEHVAASNALAAALRSAADMLDAAKR